MRISLFVSPTSSRLSAGLWPAGGLETRDTADWKSALPTAYAQKVRCALGGRRRDAGGNPAILHKCRGKHPKFVEAPELKEAEKRLRMKMPLYILAEVTFVNHCQSGSVRVVINNPAAEWRTARLPDFARLCRLNRA